MVLSFSLSLQRTFRWKRKQKNAKNRKRELDGLVLAHKQTKCNNLLLLTDHVYEEYDKDDIQILIKPVYEWCAEKDK